MAKQSTFIKLDRNIMEWRWYQNPNTFRVFLHCLLSANVSDKEFEGTTIKRGELATSYEKLANTLNLTTQQVRTAVTHLKSTGEITTKIYSKYQVISIVKYSLYQDKSTGKSTTNQHSINSQSTVNQQQYKNIKNEKNEKKYNMPDGVLIHENSGVMYRIGDDGEKYALNGDKLNSAGYPILPPLSVTGG